MRGGGGNARLKHSFSAPLFFPLCVGSYFKGRSMWGYLCFSFIFLFQNMNVWIFTLGADVGF